MLQNTISAADLANIRRQVRSRFTRLVVKLVVHDGVVACLLYLIFLTRYRATFWAWAALPIVPILLTCRTMPIPHPAIAWDREHPTLWAAISLCLTHCGVVALAFLALHDKIPL